MFGDVLANLAPVTLGNVVGRVGRRRSLSSWVIYLRDRKADEGV